MAHKGTQNNVGKGGAPHPEEEDTSAVERVAGLPLVRSLVQGVGSVYGEARARYPLLGFMGDLSSLGLRFLQLTASERTAPLRDRLQPEIQALNHYACMGLDEMEKNFPALNQSAEEVLGHLKDGLFLTLDDLQVRVTEEVDGMLEKGEQLVDVIWDLLIALQNSPAGRAVTSGLDDVLTRTEEAVALYLPIPPTLRHEFETRAQLYEDDDDEEPGTWTRVRCLLLSLTLQLYHRALKLREQLQYAIQPLGVAADTVGLTRMVETVVALLQNLMAFYLAQVKRMAGLRAVALERLSGLVQSLVRLPPVAQLQAQLQAMPAQLGEVATGLQELSTLLIQLLINTTPLYNMLEEPTEQELLEYLNQEEPCEEVMARRDCSSTSSLFLKTMDARPRRRRSFYARNRRSSTSYAPDPSSSFFSPTTTSTPSTTTSTQGSNVTPTSTPTPISTPTQAPLPANGRKGSMKNGSQPEMDTPRKASLKRGSQPELVDTPRKASLKPASQSEVETPRKASLKRGSQPELDIPRKGSLKPASQSEVETPRKASLKPGSQPEMDTPRKASLNPEIDTPRKGSLKPELVDTPRKSSLKPASQPELVDTPRRGSLKPANQPEMDTPRKGSLNPELDTPRKGSLKPELVDTPTVLPPSNMGRRRSSAAEILLTPIIQLVSQSQRALEYFSSNLNHEEDDMEEGKEEEEEEEEEEREEEEDVIENEEEEEEEEEEEKGMESEEYSE